MPFAEVQGEHRSWRSAPTKEGEERTRSEEESEDVKGETDKRDEGNVRRGQEARWCEWQVTAVGTTATMLEKWRDILPEWKWTNSAEEERPLCLAGTGNDVAQTLGNMQRTPEWVVVDGGEFHKTSVAVLKARYLKMWGVRGALSIWGIHIEKDHSPRKHVTRARMTQRFQAAVQTRLRKAYHSVDGARFKPNTEEGDFSFEQVHKCIASNPSETWGEEMQASEWRFQHKWEWPSEPTEEATPEGDATLNGIEIPETVTKEEAQERIRDLRKWQAEGMTWIGGFTDVGRKKVLRFLHENDMAIMTVMENGTKRKRKKCGDVQDVQILPEEYRPGARGKLWVWENGVGKELVKERVDDKVKFNVPNVRAAATLVGFRDARALQMLTEWGAT